MSDSYKQLLMSELKNTKRRIKRLDERFALVKSQFDTVVENRAVVNDRDGNYSYKKYVKKVIKRIRTTDENKLPDAIKMPDDVKKKLLSVADVANSLIYNSLDAHYALNINTQTVIDNLLRAGIFPAVVERFTGKTGFSSSAFGFNNGGRESVVYPQVSGYEFVLVEAAFWRDDDIKKLGELQSATRRKLSKIRKQSQALEAEADVILENFVDAFVKNEPWTKIWKENANA